MRNLSFVVKDWEAELLAAGERGAILRPLDPQPTFIDLVGKTTRKPNGFLDHDDDFHSLPIEGRTLAIKESAYISPPNYFDWMNLTRVDRLGRPRVVEYADRMNGEAIRCAEEYGIRKTPASKLPLWAVRTKVYVSKVSAVKLSDLDTEEAFSLLMRRPSCSMLYECESSSWPGVGAIRDDLSSACGGRPWQECHCILELVEGQYDEDYGPGAFDRDWSWMISVEDLPR